MTTDEQKALIDKCVSQALAIAKKTVEDYSGAKLDETEVKELEDSLTEKLKASTTEELKKANEEFEVKLKAFEDKEKALQEQIDELGIKLEKSSGNGGNSDISSVEKAFQDAFESEDFQKYAEDPRGNSEKIELQSKDVTWGAFVGDIVPPNRVGPTVVNQPLESFDVRSSIPTGTSNQSELTWDKESGYVDGYGYLAENAASAASTFNLEEVRESSKRVPTHMIISKRALKNTPFLMSYAMTRLREYLKQNLNTGVVNGDGTGENFDGLLNQAPIFTAGSFALSVQAANFADVLVVARSRMIEVSDVMPNQFWLHPTDSTKIVLTKDLQDAYITDVIVTRNEGGLIRVNGIPIIETKQIPVGEYLCIDSSVLTTQLFQCGAIDMWVADQHEDVATKNQVAVIVESEWILAVYATFRMLKGVFATDQAAILAP